MVRILLILGLLCSGAAAQATRLSADDAARLPGIVGAELDALGLPIVRAQSIKELVLFSIDQDFLAANTHLSLAGGATRVIVNGLPGVVRISSFGQIDPQDGPPSFSVLQSDSTDPRRGHVITSVSAVTGRLILSRDAELGEASMSSIQLIQDAPPEPGTLADDDPVRLLVSITRTDDPRHNVNIKVSAGSFTELRRKHAEVVNTYLRPIIRDFQQEAAVFGVPDAIAWQVLGAKYTPDARASAAVDKIVARLDADEFRDRVAAMNELRSLGQSGALVLLSTDRSRFSLQQNSAIDTFLAEFAPLGPKQSETLAADVSFLLDVLYTDDATLRRLCLDQLAAVTGSRVTLDLRGNPDELGEAIARLRARLQPATQPATQPG